MLLSLFKALASNERLRMLNIMLIRPFCLCELEIILDISQTSCTKQMKQLLTIELVECKKISLWSEYSITDKMTTVHPWLVQKIEQERETNRQFQEDIRRLFFYLEGQYEALFDKKLTAEIRSQFDQDYLANGHATTR